MFSECIDMVLDIWAGEAPYNLKGEYYSVTTANTFMPEIGQGEIIRPYQDPHPPVVGTVVSPFSPGMTALAARGWEPITGNFLLPIWAKSHWPKYVEGCEQAGRPAEPKNWRVAKNLCVAKDRETARKYVYESGSPYRLYYQQLLTKFGAMGRLNLFKEDQNIPDEKVTVDNVLDKLVIHGDPASVAEQILQFRETVGDFGQLVYAGHDWTDYDLGRESMILMAEEVMPRVNQALGE